MFCYSTSAQLERKDRDAAKDAQTHVKVSNTRKAKEHQIAKSSEKEKNCTRNPAPTSDVKETSLRNWNIVSRYIDKILSYKRLKERQMIEFYGMENDTETATVLTTERVK